MSYNTLLASHNAPIDSAFPDDHVSPEHRLSYLMDPVIRAFQKLSKKYFFFHLAFACLVAIEVGCTLLFFSSFVDSFVLGIAISLLFFTLLLYFILRLYSNEQKPEELKALVKNFLTSVESHALAQAEESDRLFHLSDAAETMAHTLNSCPIAFYSLPESIKKFMPQGELFSLEKVQKKLPHFFEKLHADQLHRQDILAFQELFLLTAIDKRTALVAHAPTSPEVHALLADSYLKLATLYEQMRNGQKYKLALMNALEELKIIDAFDPQNVEVHLKLAYCFRVLKMTSQEIHEYETIIKLEAKLEVKNSGAERHHEQAHRAQMETLYTLGILYFRTGEKAKGLRVYEK
ncbi:MAG TPA: hypothetical protein VN457_03600 [Chlamydiales bacterium]|nr:hypothetical protein [Chlamydiales bacterium]